MILDDMKEYLLTNSFQYFIGADDIEVTDEVLKMLVKRALAFYSSWRPLFVQEQISTNQYLFTYKETSEGKRVLNVQNIYYMEPILTGYEGKVDWDWDYNREHGQLRVQVKGNYIVELLVAPDLSDMDYSHVEFMDLVLALYLMYVGSSRKAFVLGEQPFENDGADIYSFGQELWERTLESLQNEQSNWYLAIQ